MYYIRTADTVEPCESLSEAEAIAKQGVTITDDDGITYDLHIELQPRIQPKWLSGLCITPEFAMV